MALDFILRLKRERYIVSLLVFVPVNYILGYTDRVHLAKMKRVGCAP